MVDRYHHGALADAMVDEALREVRERGPEDVSLRRIAQEVGVSPSAAYNHFADKDALLQRVGRCGHDELDARMAAAVAGQPGRSAAAAVARFRALGEAYISFALEDPNLFRLTFSPLCFTMKDDEGNADGPFQRLLDALGDLRTRGLLRAEDDESLGLTVWSTVHGLSVLILEGAVPAESAAVLLDEVARLVLVDAPASSRRRPAGSAR